MGKDYYKILGVPKDANEAQLKQAYRKLAIKWHPDKNLERKEEATTKFQEVGEAYAVLSDPEKRRVYDMVGEEGLKGGGMPEAGGGGRGMGGIPAGASFSFSGIDPNDIFASFFGTSNPFEAMGGSGGGGGSGVNASAAFSGLPGGLGGMFGMMGGMPGMVGGMGGTSGIPGMSGMGGLSGGGGGGIGKVPPVEHNILCSLEELYNGTTKRMKVNRKRLDPSAGVGALRQEATTLEVTIQPGFKAGTKIKFEGAGDEAPGAAAGDVVFVLAERPHPVFRREGDDLVMTKQVSLLDALLGPRFSVHHIDGRAIPVTVSSVVGPNRCKVIDGEGFPRRGKKARHHDAEATQPGGGRTGGLPSGAKGALKIFFDVQFPKSLDDRQKQLLREALGPPSS